MLTNKDIRVENGNIVINGDKYPLDGQSPAAIMQIVEDNSDTTPTENSDAPITSGGVFNALEGKEDTLTFDTAPTAESANPVTSAGIKTYVDGLITVSEVTVNSQSTGYAAPVQSGGGVYFEQLATYASLSLDKSKILSVELVNWHATAKSFNLYLGDTTIGVMTDSNTSIFNGATGDLVLRVVSIR